MADALRLLRAGDDGVLIELDTLARTRALMAALSADRQAGVLEMVPAARTLLLRYDPLETSFDQLAQAILPLEPGTVDIPAGEQFHIPVIYDGEDLAEVAQILGLSVDALIARHTAATYSVAFVGFAPGFAYMMTDDPGLVVPRRKTPRARVPAGSVAIAGPFGGIYPSDKPGGWQLLGRTSVRMWDVSRPRPALLAPGDRVRFVATTYEPPAPPPAQPKPAVPRDPTGLQITRADRPVYYQDLGRPWHADQGIGGSGALDCTSLAEANRCVGNPPGAVALEIAYGGFALRTDRAVTIAIAGAVSRILIGAPDGRITDAPHHRPIALDAGDEIFVDIPSAGTRSYLALRGGFAVETFLGSGSWDSLASAGPQPLAVGDMLTPADRPAGFVDAERAPRSLPVAAEPITLDVTMGPRADWFTPEAIDAFFTSDWTVTAASDRIGMRLAGPAPLTRQIHAELPSEGMVAGAIQVPPDGQPVLFMRDHPITGGYPVIAVLSSRDIDTAAQCPIGASIRFRAIDSFHPVSREATP